MKPRFHSRRMTHIAAQAGADDDSTRRERQLGMSILAVVPRRRRKRDVIAELDAEIAKAERTMGRNYRRRRHLTPEERQARYEATLARVYRHRWTLKNKGE